MAARVISPIVPANTVHILRNVPLDNSYQDTLDFTSVSAQTTYFLSKVKYSNVNITPVRMQNKIRVDKTADHLYDCNYIMFNNANYEGKWFYAFITSIDFINTNMAEISFELDVWQSWWPNIALQESFIEREHTNNDAIGSNLVPENLEHGDYTFNLKGRSGHLTTYVYNVYSTAAPDGTDVSGKRIGGLYSGAGVFSFTDSSTGETELNNMITTLTEMNKSDAIVSIVKVPSDFADPSFINVRTYDISFTKDSSQIDGYTPKNNKLFTYPYNFLYIHTGTGNSADMPYEYFSTSNCQFTLVGDMSPNPTIVLYPKSYKGVTSNFNEKMALDGFPQCTYNIDSFKAWLAQNGSATAINVMSQAVGFGAAAATKDVLGAVNSAAGIAQTLNQVAVQSTRPPQANGAQGTATLVASGMLDFYFYNATIRQNLLESSMNFSPCLVTQRIE